MINLKRASGFDAWPGKNSELVEAFPFDYYKTVFDDRMHLESKNVDIPSSGIVREVSEWAVDKDVVTVKIGYSQKSSRSAQEGLLLDEFFGQTIPFEDAYRRNDDLGCGDVCWTRSSGRRDFIGFTRKNIYCVIRVTRDASFTAEAQLKQKAAAQNENYELAEEFRRKLRQESPTFDSWPLAKLIADKIDAAATSRTLDDCVPLVKFSDSVSDEGTYATVEVTSSDPIAQILFSSDYFSYELVGKNKVMIFYTSIRPISKHKAKVICVLESLRRAEEEFEFQLERCIASRISDNELAEEVTGEL